MNSQEIADRILVFDAIEPAQHDAAFRGAGAASIRERRILPLGQGWQNGERTQMNQNDRTHESSSIDNQVYHAASGFANSFAIRAGKRHTRLPSRSVKYRRDSEGCSGSPSAQRA